MSGSSSGTSTGGMGGDSTGGMGGAGGASTGGMGGMGGNSTGGMGGDSTGGMGGMGGDSTGGMGGMGGTGGGGCVVGSMDSCYSGPAGTQIVGLCRAGLKTCLANGTYGPCMGEVVPTAEICATMGDDDCDGMANEEGADCACVPNMMTSCYTGPMGTVNVGNCKAGTQTCNAQGTAYGPCVGQVVPQMEDCALVGDEDCDGQINEGGLNCVCLPNSTTTCYTGPMGTVNVGECKAGMKACNAQGTAYGPCVGEVVPQMEDCALAGDEDCDGQVSEGGLNCVCLPNSMTACYTGPMGTQNVGLCRGGMKACNAQGTAYGPCVGEVVPAAETCNTAGDDDCDGMSNEGCSAIWAKGVGGTGDEDVYDVAVDSQGNIIVVGYFRGTINLGGGPLTTPNGNSDIFVAKFDAAGGHMWSRQFGGTGIDGARGVAVDQFGTVAVTGSFQSTVDFGGGPFTSVGGTHDIFILALDSGGNHLLSGAFGGSGGDEGSAITFDPLGNAILVGHMTGTVDFGGGPLTSAGGDDGFVAKFSQFGAHLWSYRFGDANTQNIKDVATDSNGNVYFTGFFSGTTDFGGGALTSAGLEDSMLVKYSSAGAHVWTRQIGGAFSQFGWSVAVDTQNDVVVAGQAHGMVDFGGGTMTTAGNGDIFTVKYNSNNALQWAKLYGDSTEQTGFGIKTDAQNNVLVAGRMNGTADFGGGTLTSGGLSDAFLAKLDGASTQRWSRNFGDGMDQMARAVAVDNAGNVIVVGRYQGTIDFGTGALSNAGGLDIFITKYGP